jgi:hypothetical protein
MWWDAGAGVNARNLQGSPSGTAVDEVRVGIGGLYYTYRIDMVLSRGHNLLITGEIL